jgi:hypothetical protein
LISEYNLIIQTIPEIEYHIRGLDYLKPWFNVSPSNWILEGLVPHGYEGIHEKLITGK